MTKKQALKKIEKIVYSNGGKAYFVGGYVRDFCLHKKSDDIDIEVYNIEKDKLYNLLKKEFKICDSGKDFGIYKLLDCDVDIALPRTEKLNGKTHKDFIINSDENLSVLEASKRRDFTVNAMYLELKTKKIIDCYNGKKDLKNKVLKKVSESFSEDGLRVLRGVQFASRFNFSFEEETYKTLKEMDIKNLSKERVEGEMKKAILLSKKPSVFFKYLKDLDKLCPFFQCLNDLKREEFINFCNMLDNFAKKRKSAENQYAFMLLPLVFFAVKNKGKIEKKGAFSVKEEIEKIVVKKQDKKYLMGFTIIAEKILNGEKIQIKENKKDYFKGIKLIKKERA